MSARPRPVTATFKPKSMQPQVKPRSYSLSSGGSTDSLISVLDHDSFHELDLSDIEPEVQPRPTTQEKPVTEEKKKRYRRHTHESVENGMIRHKACMDQIENKQKSTTNLHRSEESASSDKEAEDDGLTPWEQWLLQKAKEDRDKVRQEIRQKKKEKAEQRRKKEELATKQKKGEEKFQEWLDKKMTETKVKSNQSVRQEKLKKNLEEEKKHEIEEKSKQKYEEWASQKKNQEKEKKRQERDEKERKQREKEELQKKCDAAYDEWCKKVQNRPKSAQSNTSFGYTSGKLTGYYDSSAHPAPTFYNPKPWVPVEVPRPKSEKTKRPKSKKKWNPNKYL